MESVLFLCHRLPWPPDKGDKIRSYRIFRRLAERYRVYLGTFVDDPADWPWSTYTGCALRELLSACIKGV